jgi:hypothetical protein
MLHALNRKFPDRKVIPKYVPLHERCLEKKYIGIDGNEQA